MFKSRADTQSIHRQFQDMNASLISLVGTLSRTGDPRISTAIQDLTRLTRGLENLEQLVKQDLGAQQKQLGALMGIGQAINSSLGLNQVLEEVMDTVIELMRAERGFLMLRESDGELTVRIARGIAQINLDQDEFFVSKSVVRKAVESGEPILTTNAQQDPRFGGQASVAAYHLLSIICAPLKLKNELIGVMYVDNRARTGMFQENDLRLISAFADQAAVAIDNARLFENLRATNAALEGANFELAAAKLELEIAYDATLKGWVHALDLRDKETEGHTQRVTVLTERLANAMGVESDQMIHIKRGALLHDIGKMAISDVILRKPGQLTADERALMQQHPKYAYDMLKQIEFLRPALDIPYCHHEKWDGTGYPRNLKGDEIPYAARIFPVIDVWDALTSERPYHRAMAQDEVREKIREDAGKHFDPRAVEAFMAMNDLTV